jgi:hypothetical protein
MWELISGEKDEHGGETCEMEMRPNKMILLLNKKVGNPFYDIAKQRSQTSPQFCIWSFVGFVPDYVEIQSTPFTHQLRIVQFG